MLELGDFVRPEPELGPGDFGRPGPELEPGDFVRPELEPGDFVLPLVPILAELLDALLEVEVDGRSR